MFMGGNRNLKLGCNVGQRPGHKVAISFSCKPNVDLIQLLCALKRYVAGSMGRVSGPGVRRQSPLKLKHF